MTRLTPGGLLILAAISIPFALELRTVAAIFGFELSLVAVVVIEAAFLGLLFLAYTMQTGESAHPQ